MCVCFIHVTLLLLHIIRMLLLCNNSNHCVVCGKRAIVVDPDREGHLEICRAGGRGRGEVAVLVFRNGINYWTSRYATAMIDLTRSSRDEVHFKSRKMTIIAFHHPERLAFQYDAACVTNTTLGDVSTLRPRNRYVYDRIVPRWVFDHSFRPRNRPN